MEKTIDIIGREQYRVQSVMEALGFQVARYKIHRDTPEVKVFPRSRESSHTDSDDCVIYGSYLHQAHRIVIANEGAPRRTLWHELAHSLQDTELSGELTSREEYLMDRLEMEAFAIERFTHLSFHPRFFEAIDAFGANKALANKREFNNFLIGGIYGKGLRAFWRATRDSIIAIKNETSNKKEVLAWINKPENQTGYWAGEKA